MRVAYLYLLIALLTMVVLFPFLQGEPGSQAVLSTIVMVLAVSAISAHRRNFIIAIALGAPTLAAEWLELVIEIPEFPILRLLLNVIFYVFVIAVILRHLLRAKTVTLNEVYGAVCLYVLLGVVWFFLYIIVEISEPGSFNNLGRIDETPQSSHGDLLYFSYVTLTTLGYGDITPATPHARALAILEAISGVIVLSVLIARFVGMYIAHNSSSSSS